MYVFMKNGVEVGAETSPQWVGMQSNGYFGLCDAAAAEGVNLGGTVYHLAGRPALAGCETVNVVQMDAKTYFETQSQNSDAVWDELDAAYQEGYSEGYTEGVNGAYDQ